MTRPVILPSVPARWPPILVFVCGCAFVFYTNGWFAGIWTVLLALVIWLTYAGLVNNEPTRKGFAYLVFFITPLLSMTGQISVLTGFGGSGASKPWVGVSFVTASLALHLFAGKLSFRELWLSILQPVRMNSGPVALTGSTMPRLTLARAWLYIGWLVLGAFFYCVLAAGIEPFLILKSSTEPLDILIFAILFEFYVYFNFSGITFMVFGILSLGGVRTVINFNTPFAARDVIGYWQRWHISLTTVLKHVFFKPIKKRLGMALAVTVVFMSSAAWHGVSINFFMWGLFHASAWLLTYAIARQLPWKRCAFWVNAIIFPFAVVIGRLIFSESDTQFLLIKLERLLLHFSVSQDAMVMNMIVDWQSVVMLGFGGLCVAAEVLSGVRFRRYRLLRKKWIMLLQLLCCLAIGSTGLGGVYGAR